MNRTPSPLRVETITIDGTRVPYRVRRSARARHARITISPYDGVVVTLPLRPEYYVSPARFLRERAPWVLRQFARVAPPVHQPPLGNGSLIPIRGRLRTLRVGLTMGESRFALVGDEVHARIPLPSRELLRKGLRDWLFTHASRAIERVVQREAERIGVDFERITIRNQKTKWGSCTKGGNLSFNWRLILFPPSILKYVVVHELCHLRHFNHSQRYWALVARHYPKYHDAIEWLRRHGHHSDLLFRERVETEAR